MRFANREQAGQLLAERLKNYKGVVDVVVLGMARGGVPVAFEIAKKIEAPLDVFILRKLGVPRHEELAFGAIASGGVHIIDQETIDAAGLSPIQIHQAVTQARKEMERRERLYGRDKSPLELKGKTVILADDGIATGSSVRAAVAAVRKLNAERIVVAVPVAPLTTVKRLRLEADELVCLHAPESFYAVGQFYDDFSEVTDSDVRELLRRASLADGKVA
jgi:putative phosphoribosyl transferase